MVRALVCASHLNTKQSGKGHNSGSKSLAETRHKIWIYANFDCHLFLFWYFLMAGCDVCVVNNKNIGSSNKVSGIFFFCTEDFTPLGFINAAYLWKLQLEMYIQLYLQTCTESDRSFCPLGGTKTVHFKSRSTETPAMNPAWALCPSPSVELLHTSTLQPEASQPFLLWQNPYTLTGFSPSPSFMLSPSPHLWPYTETTL